MGSFDPGYKKIDYIGLNKSGSSIYGDIPKYLTPMVNEQVLQQQAEQDLQKHRVK
jgi:hypothetical protein